ncbi:MAG: tetratricopeptide repeat protein [Planctomycetes bacterium]|nr:tetratricopeptide repeat protein [Planctomycetota bacterium]
MRSRTKHALAYATTTAGIASEVFFGLQEKAGPALAAEGLAAALGAPGAGLLLGVLAKAGGSALTSLGINLFSTRIDQSAAADLNHDLAKASGAAIAAVIRSEAPQQAGLRAKRRELDALADEIERRHDPEQLERASGEAPPVDPGELLTNPGGFLKRIALTRAEWEDYLFHVGKEACERLHLVGTDLRRVAETLEEHYGEALYRQLKASAADDGKAFAGAVLRLLETVLTRLDRMHADLASTSEATWKAVLQLRKDLDVGKMTAAIDALLRATKDYEEVLIALRNTVQDLPARLDELGAKLDAQTALLIEIGAKIDSQRSGSHPLPEGRTNVGTLGARSFHGRDEIFRTLRARFARTDSFALAVLHGPPGVGKSELAREYARRNAATYPGGMLFIEAIGSLAASLAEVGRRLLGLHRPDLSIDDQAYSVLYALGEKPTLLILDGVRDPAELDLWLPSANAACHVIVTTNNGMWDRDAGPIRVDPLPNEAARMLVADLAPEADEAGRELIVRHAGGVTQQIVPAAKALSHAARMRRNFDVKLSLEASTCLEAPYASLDTDAQLILHGLAFLRSTSVPFDELQIQFREPLGLTKGTFDAAVDSCLSTSLIDAAEEGVKLHQLTVEFIEGRSLTKYAADRLVPVRQQQRMRFIKLAGQVGEDPGNSCSILRFLSFPTDPAHWRRSGLELDGASVCSAIGYALRVLGRYTEAVPWLDQAVATAEKGDIDCRVDHRALGMSMQELGICHSNISSTQDGLPWFMRAVDSLERGDLDGRVDHDALARSLLHVGVCYGTNGLPWFERAVKAAEGGALYGRLDHPTLGDCLEHVGVIHSLLGRFPEALSWLERAAAAKERGDLKGCIDSDSLGRTFHAIGDCHAGLEHFRDALPWYERAVTTKMRGDVHGRVSHASVGESQHLVGYCNANLRRFQDALFWLERAVASAEHGDCHGRINNETRGKSLHCAGECLVYLKRFSEAIPLFERAVAAKELGDIHGRRDKESLRSTLLMLATCLEELQQWERAAGIRKWAESH